jgi:hypothetical protein
MALGIISLKGEHRMLASQTLFLSSTLEALNLFIPMQPKLGGGGAP